MKLKKFLTRQSIKKCACKQKSNYRNTRILNTYSNVGTHTLTLTSTKYFDTASSFH